MVVIKLQRLVQTYIWSSGHHQVIVCIMFLLYAELNWLVSAWVYQHISDIKSNHRLWIIKQDMCIDCRLRTGFNQWGKCYQQHSARFLKSNLHCTYSCMPFYVQNTVFYWVTAVFYMACMQAIELLPSKILFLKRWLGIVLTTVFWLTGIMGV